MGTMDWKDPEYRAALLRLWEIRVLRRTRKVQPLVKHLLELGWVTQSSRQAETTLNDLGAAHLPALLDRVWPAWRQTLQQLRAADLPLSAEGLADLVRQSRPLPPLPSRLHHKTYAAIAGAHSKWLPARKLLPPDLIRTTDGVLRIRANQGLILCIGTQEISCDDWMAAVGEVILPERAVLDGCTPCGILPEVVMTVENLGPFVDMPKPEQFLLIHQPGWNTPLSLQFLQALGPEPSWYHFGDLDPEGLAIYQHLNREGRRVHLFVPSFWDEYQEAFGHRLSDGWPRTIAESFPEPLLKKLFAANCWLEQEPIILDERLHFELAGLL